MEEAGVPVVHGYYGEDQSNARLKKESEKTGFPLLIKAAAGGGGRGMRVVESVEAFLPAVDEARREAQAGFGDSRVLLERYVSNPRHVEFQIFGDWKGNVIHLHERECSIQRRHQKIIEESPSPVLTSELREQMAHAAITAAKAAGYVNAGTVEFLVENVADGQPRFYFLEVNTRLQVEHPVTELRTGIDFVKLQLRIAAGERLPYRQDDICPNGHAIEARIYAEDPSAGFLPSIGRLKQWIPPEGPWIRFDSGVERGSEVTSFYDSLLAKLIVRGENRQEALNRLQNALEQFHVLGVQTNIPYLIAIVRNPVFQSGDIHTGFLEANLPGWQPPAEPPDEALLALAALCSASPDSPVRTMTASNTGDAHSPWREASGWRN